jgi:hypothetical protein
MGWRRWADWKVLAVGIEVAAASGAVALGWQLVHAHPAGPAVSIQAATTAAASPFLGIPGMPAMSLPPSSSAAGRPGLPDILQRVNQDDAGLYHGQWATIQLLARGTRDYLERHILPLLLAAARGGK